MRGRRIDPPPSAWSSGFCPYEPGDYWKDDLGWHLCTPNGLVGWVKNHHVEEHEDGTISVLPGPWGPNSVLVSNRAGNKSWHGYIRRGVWEEC